jgi:hypothetical protein
VIRRVAIVVAVLAVSPLALATIGGMQQLKLDFTKADVAKQATWTKHEKLVRDGRGLRFDAPGTDSLDFSIQTTEPYAIGTTWRPARGASIVARVSPPFAPIKLPNGETYTPYAGSMFARYSPDAKHWSSWQVLRSTTTAKAFEFSGELGVPRAAASEYDELLTKYGKLDVPWKSDEEAAVKWIVAAQPDFFEKHQPFVGYVQFLYETSLSGGQPIAHVDIDISFAVGGGASKPKDPQAQKNREGAWRYRAP